MKVLETERLILRHLTVDDLDNLFALYRDSDIRQYFPEGTLTYQETREELEWIINVYYAQYGFGLWATILKDTNQFIGRCGLLPRVIDDKPEVEVAYMIAKQYWRQGLGGEAARAIVGYGFEQLHLSRIVAFTHPENRASIRTAQRAGLIFEREIEVKSVRALQYAISKPNVPSASHARRG